MSVLLAFLELVGSGLLLGSTKVPELEVCGLYFLLTICIITTINLFLVLPFSLAFSTTLTDFHIAIQAGSAVYGTIANYYFTFIVWSHLRRMNEDGAPLALPTFQSHRDNLPKEATAAVAPPGATLEMTTQKKNKNPARETPIASSAAASNLQESLVQQAPDYGEYRPPTIALQ